MKTSNIMTKYEKARLLGLRAQQISNGSPLMIDANGEIDPLKLALLELRARKFPLKIERSLPDNKKEIWEIEDMIIP